MIQPLALVRHAAASGQEATAALTVEGHRQAQRLAEVLVPFQLERVISSPFVRAVDSIAPFCTRAHVPLETDDRLVERVLNAPPAADWRAHLRQSFEDLDYALDGGESGRTAQARGVSVMRTAIASGQRCVLVTHGNLLALLLQSLDPTFGFERWANLSNPDVFVLRGAGDAPTGFQRVWPASYDR